MTGRSSMRQRDKIVYLIFIISPKSIPYNDNIRLVNT
jgi:hypothetical protein